MATRAGKISIVISASDRQFIRGMQRSRAELKGFGRVTDGVKRKLGGLGAQIGVAAAAYGAFRIIKSATRALGEQEESLKRLSAALQATGRDAKALDALAASAAEIQKQSTVGDEALIRATAKLALLAPALSIPELQQAQKAIVGIADAFTEGNVEAAALTVGKSLGGTVDLLARYGLAIGTTGTIQEKFNRLLDRTTPLFEAQKISATSLTGRVKQLSNAWGDLLENLASFIGDESLANDVLVKLRKGVEFASDVLLGTPEQVGRAALAIGSIIGAKLGEGIFRGLQEAFRVGNPLTHLPLVGEFFEDLNVGGRGLDAAIGGAADLASSSAAIARGTLLSVRDEIVEAAANALRDFSNAGGKGEAGERTAFLGPNARLLNEAAAITAASTQLDAATLPVSAGLVSEEEIRARGIQYQRAMQDVFGSSMREAQRSLQPAAANFGTQLALDIVNGFKNAADILKNTLLSVVGGILTGGLSSVFRGGSFLDALPFFSQSGGGGGNAFGGGGVISQSGAGSIEAGGATLSISLEGATLFGDPVRAARDPGSQVFIREATVVAREDGFR